MTPFRELIDSRVNAFIILVFKKYYPAEIYHGGNQRLVFFLGWAMKM